MFVIELNYKVDLTKIDAHIEVTVAGKVVPCIAWRVDRYVKSTLYLLEPQHEAAV